MSKKDETKILQAAVARGTVVPWLGNSDALMQVKVEIHLTDDVESMFLLQLDLLSIYLTPPITDVVW